VGLDLDVLTGGMDRQRLRVRNDGEVIAHRDGLVGEVDTLTAEHTNECGLASAGGGDSDHGLASVA
jgi:hypothetical protein